MKQELNFKNLAEFDGGRIAIGFDMAIERIVDDIKDRPALDTARKIVLTGEFVPVTDDVGDLDDVKVVFKLKCQAPEQSTRRHTMDLRGKKLAFDDLSPDDPDQATLGFGE